MRHWCGGSVSHYIVLGAEQIAGQVFRRLGEPVYSCKPWAATCLPAPLPSSHSASLSLSLLLRLSLSFCTVHIMSRVCSCDSPCLRQSVCFFWLEMPTRHHTLQFLISTGGEGSVGRGRSGRSGELEQTLIDFVQLDRQSKSSRTDWDIVRGNAK